LLEDIFKRNELPDELTGSAEDLPSRPVRDPKTETYLYMNPILGLATHQKLQPGISKMKRTHQLIKLKVETIGDLKRLRSQMGAASLDDLIAKIIKLTDAHRIGLKDLGWGSNSTG